MGNTLGLTTLCSQSPADFARLYHENGLVGGHVIKLGSGNDPAAKEALAAWPSMQSFCWLVTALTLAPGGLQIGGGITDTNASEWIQAGASKVDNDRVKKALSCR